jgi:hypothetical protein
LNPITTAFEASARLMSDLGDAADRAVHDVDLHLVGGELGERVGEALVGALHVGLDDERERLGALGELVEDVLELRRLLLGELHVAELALAEERDLARLALVAEHLDVVAGARHVLQALDLDRDRGPGLGDRLAVLVVHRAHAPEHGAREQHVALLEGARLHQHRRHRAAALVEARLDHHALGGRVHRRLELEHLGLQLDRLEQLVDALAGLGRDLDELGLAAELSETISCDSSSFLMRCGFASGLSILLTATMTGTFAALAWAIASTVCGITPSSAATTRITRSVIWLPRARMAVKASWPGVSRNVITPLGVSTW